MAESGGFGTFLLFAHEWADPAATRRSYELFAQYVMPRYTGQLEAPNASCDWVTGSGGEFVRQPRRLGEVAPCQIGVIALHDCGRPLVEVSDRAVARPDQRLLDPLAADDQDGADRDTVLPELQVARLFEEVQGFNGYSLTIDLPRQVVIKADGTELPFDVQPFRKYCLVNGFDDIGLTLRHADKIKAYEAHRLARMPWLAQTLTR